MEFIESKFMAMLEEPEQKDKDWNHVEFESEAYGCEVNSKITRPDMVILGYKVGANIDITGDGHIGGDKLFREKVCI